MELKETVEMMNSADYKERFIAEYRQTKIRYEKLKKLLNKWDAYVMRYNQGDDLTLEQFLGFQPSCSYEILREQQSHMGLYLHCLEVRAVIEGIDLEGGK